MSACDNIQTRLLDYLYGLLEEHERDEVAAHLASCSACQTALRRAEEQRGLLAEAAKSEFPDVRFVPPFATKLPKSSRLRKFSRLALAASVLLALVGGGAVALFGWHERQSVLTQADGELALAQARLSESRRRGQDELERLGREARQAETAVQQFQTERQRTVEQGQREIQNLKTDWERATRDVIRSLQSKKVQVVIQGPRNMQAGARNQYQITMRPTAPGTTAKGPMLVRVVAPESKRVLFEKQFAGNAGQAVVDLPPDLPLKPGVDLALEVEAKLAEGGPVQVSERVPLVPSLYMTHLMTDRPMYRPGETVRFRSLTLERFSLKPADENLQIRFQITDPRGSAVFNASGIAEVTKPGSSEPIKGPDGKPVRGIGAGEFKLTEGAEGGEYTLHVSDEANRFPAEKRKFIVAAYQVPRLNAELVFTRKSYGPGEEVEARCAAARVEGGTAFANQPVSATLNVDGQVLPQANLQTDAKGKVLVKFRLPNRIDKGDATLSVMFLDGGTPETIVRPVPIVLKKLIVNFYPEGGDLIAGVPNRVYFQVQTTLGKPAELRGHIVDQDGNSVLPVQTLNDDLEAGVNQGLGVFSFVPQTAKKYELKIDAPIGIEGTHLLPTAKAEGVVLNIPKGVVEDRIEVMLHNTGKDRRLVVGAYCRGRLIENSEPIDMKPGESRTVRLHTATGISGVYRVTVFEATRGAVEKGLAPVAERLIYRRPVETLTIAITPDKAVYHPGGRAKLSLKATNEKKEPAPSILMASVVDLRVFKLADEKTARTMPAQFYLASEVQKADELEYADFLISAHPKAAAAVDLLLGTQGWRRFGEQNPQELLLRHRQAGERLLALSGQAMNFTINTNPKPAMDELDRKYAAKIVSAQTSLSRKQMDLDRKVSAAQKQLTGDRTEAAKAAARTQAEAQSLETIVREVAMEINVARQALEEYKRFVFRIGAFALAGGMLLACVACLIIGLMRVITQARNAIPYLVTGISLLIVLIVIGAGGALYFIETSAPQAAADRERAAEPAAQKAGEAKTVATRPAPQARALAPAAKRAEKAAPKTAAAKGGLGGGGFKGMPMAKKKAQTFTGPLPQAMRMAPPGKAPVAADAAKAAPLGHLRALDAKFMAPPPNRANRGFALADGMAFRAEARLQGGPMARNGLRRLAPAQEREQQKALILKELAQPFAIREYAHTHTVSADKVRRDFTETLYWRPVLVLPDGSAEISFDLSDSTTQFQVLCQGHTLDGRLGANTLLIASRLPYSIEPKIPSEISSTDKLAIPVTIANDTPESKDVAVEVMAGGLKSAEMKQQIKVPGGERKRALFRFEPSIVEGQATLNLTGQFDPATSDRVERTFKIVPDGFPVVGSHSDMLEGVGRHEIVLPESWIPGTLKCQVQVFPATLADLQKGLEAMLREPCGCFEQSSSSNYPNVLILSYLKESQQNQPAVEQRARHLLQNGYQRLISFECVDPQTRTKRQGYEWFGQTAPPHEALTAYGLLQFRDMARFQPVDEAMVERTRKYLLDQRDGTGGFKRNTRAIDTFGRAPEDITNAYIVWALTESGPDDVERELATLVSQAGESKDPYFLALVANSLVNRAKAKESAEILKKLSELQQTDGHLEGTRTSITGSGGRDLQIETTALAMLAWLKANRPEFNEAVNKAVKWIGTQRGGYGGFGATQSTILALKALIAHTRANRKTAHAGELRLFVHDQTEPVSMQAFPAGCQEPIVIAIKGDSTLKPGKNKLRFEITGNNAFPYALSWSYRTVKPANPADCPVHVSAKLGRTKVREGDTVRLNVLVENKSGKGQGMAVAIVGLPAGLSLPENFAQLKDLARPRDNGTKAGVISFWEIRGRELVLYWRELSPDQKIPLSLDLVCRLPGEYRGPASRAYLYYNADRKYWIEPIAVSIEPR